MRLSTVLILVAACNASGSNTNPDAKKPGDGKQPMDTPSGCGSQCDAPNDGVVTTGGKTIFIIVMENESATNIYGSSSAPYINNTLVPLAVKATMFQDELPGPVPSEPHYIWMEAGTNVFSDITFSTDSDASSGNSTASTNHLVTQLETAGKTWVTYQEGVTTGTCPISTDSTNFYAAKHNPFVFFQDVSGATPATNTARCANHTKAYSAFATDLAANAMPNYVFITPNLCDDMHGASGCPSGSNITNGDTWLSSEMPRIMTYANAHNSVIYLTWDEGSSTTSQQLIAFLAFGPYVNANTMDSTHYTHSSMLKSVEEQLGVPVLSTVTSANDFSPMFAAGHFP